MFAAGIPIVSAALSVAFPGDGQSLPAVEQTYVIGAVSVTNAAPLVVNGATTDVWRTGAFLAMVPVKPGTNTLNVTCGTNRLERRFLVAEPPKPGSWKPFKPVTSAKDPRLGKPSAWRTRGTLFANRVRPVPDDGDTLHYLPPQFTVRGAEVEGTDWIAVWIGGKIGFMSPATLVKTPAVPVPSANKPAPDPAACFPSDPPRGVPLSAIRILVDPGHGGSDTGALSPHGWCEKDVNLSQARAIRDALKKEGFEVLMTRDGDSFPPLYGRPKLAYDEHVDAFISVHHNACRADRNPREVRHTTTYASNERGLALAAAIQKRIAAVLPDIKNSGAQTKSLAVCRNPAVPSCLLEVDFINLPEGEEASWDPERQKKVAAAVARGVLDWMK
jgi:N-acetylmuramoyl-L-alanine amidase